MTMTDMETENQTLTLRVIDGNVVAERSYEGDTDSESADLAMFCQYFCSDRETLLKVAAAVIGSTSRDELEMIYVLGALEQLTRRSRKAVIEFRDSQRHED